MIAATLLVLVISLIIIYRLVKEFQDYESEVRVPDDIVKIVGEHLYSQQQSMCVLEGNQIPAFTVKSIIPKAEGQRTSWQFAAMILLSKIECINLRNFRYKPNNSRLPIDTSRPFVPSKEEFNNYIAARPEHGIIERVAEYYNLTSTKHAENIILEQFEDLLQGYGKENKDDLASIILYSWIMPCTQCTTKIINTLGNRKLKITVVYTIHFWYAKESKLVQKSNRSRLQQAGFSVEQVKYPIRLSKRNTSD